MSENKRATIRLVVKVDIYYDSEEAKEKAIKSAEQDCLQVSTTVGSFSTHPKSSKCEEVAHWLS